MKTTFNRPPAPIPPVETVTLEISVNQYERLRTFLGKVEPTSRVGDDIYRLAAEMWDRMPEVPK